MNPTFELSMQVIGGLTFFAFWLFGLACLLNGFGPTVGAVSLQLRRCEKAIMLHRERAAKAQQSRFAREYEAGPNLWDEGQGEA